MGKDFDEYILFSMCKISTLVNENTSKINTSWSKSTAKRIIRNKVYVSLKIPIYMCAILKPAIECLQFCT